MCREGETETAGVDPGPGGAGAGAGAGAGEPMVEPITRGSWMPKGKWKEVNPKGLGLELHSESDSGTREAREVVGWAATCGPQPGEIGCG